LQSALNIYYEIMFFDSDLLLLLGGWGLPPAYDRWELVRWQNEQVARRTTAQRAILVFPLLAPVVYFIFSWIVRGFRHDNRSQENAPEPDKQKGRRLRPASTLLLILSILFF